VDLDSQDVRDLPQMPILLTKQAPCHEIIVKCNLEAPVMRCFRFATSWLFLHSKKGPYNTFAHLCKLQKPDGWLLDSTEK
jgi:hypothetical protein